MRTLLVSRETQAELNLRGLVLILASRNKGEFSEDDLFEMIVEDFPDLAPLEAKVRAELYGLIEGQYCSCGRGPFFETDSGGIIKLDTCPKCKKR